MRLIIYLLLFLGNLGIVFAQQGSSPIIVLAHRVKDTVILRWVPKTYTYWHYGKEKGYVVERYELPKDLSGLASAREGVQRLNLQAIKIAEKAFLQSQISDSTYSMVQELLYPEGENKSTKGGFMGQQEAKQDAESYMGFALYLSDLNPKVADLCALRFTDAIDTTKNYVYRVKFAQEPKIPYNYEEVMVNGNHSFPHPKVSKIFVTPGHKKIQVRWDIQKFKGIYSAYYLQRSTDSVHFESVSKIPISVLADAKEAEEPKDIVYTDSIDTDHQYLYYRVAGITPFATKGKYSTIIKTKGIVSFRPYLRITGSTLTQSNTLYITWKSKRNEGESAIKTYWVERSQSDTGPYMPIHKKALESSVLSYEEANPKSIGYYRVCAESIEGQRACSMPNLSLLRDSIAPIVAQGLSATINQQGLLQLRWLANTEQDILGYRIYYQARPQADYIPWTSEALWEPIFTESISLNTLDRYLYLSVVVEDMNHNLSPYSKALKIALPDIIAPMPPSVKHYDNTTGKVSIRWQRSASKDVRNYYLQRDSDIIKRLKNEEELQYEDINIQGNTGYAYRLCAVDSSENKGCTPWLKIKTLPMPCHKILTFKRLSNEDDEPNRIQFTWTIEKNVGQKYILYRKNKEEQWTPYDWIASKTTIPLLYEKKGENIGAYHYGLQAECPGGNKSEIKEER